MFASSVLAILAAMPFVQLALAADCTRTYTVVQGDICDSISAANNVSTWQLAAVNKQIIDKGCDNLLPGEVLCLGTPGQDCTSTYVVRPNDTCDIITSAQGINSTILQANNPNIDCNNLYIGQVLCVAGEFAAPSAPTDSVPVTDIPPSSTPAVVTSTAVLPTTSDAVVTTSVVVTSTPAITSSIAISISTVSSAAVVTESASSSIISSAAPSASASSDDDDDDDDDLPFCDEL